MRYEPAAAPVPETWLAAHGEDRIEAVRAWHLGASEHEPEEGWGLHASLHAQVETRIAEGGPEGPKLIQLTSAGLSRHDAVHAIAAALRELMERVVREGAEVTGLDALLRDLTAERWLQAESRRADRERRSDPGAAARKKKARRKAQRKARKRRRG